MLKEILSTFFLSICTLSLFAQTNVGDVCYIEKQGNGSSRVFSVCVAPQKRIENMEEDADRTVINAILFNGVENYNGGKPLVSDEANAFAVSLVDKSKQLYKGYCKGTYLESSSDHCGGYFVVVVNHFNLLRVLNYRKAMATPFEED